MEPKATHRREGEAGYNVLLNGTMGDTLRSQTISIELQQIAQQAAMPYGQQSYAPIGVSPDWLTAR